MKGTNSGTALQVVWQGQQHFTLRKVHQHVYTLWPALATELYRNTAHQGQKWALEITYTPVGLSTQQSQPQV